MTTLRNIIGGMDLEQALTSRDEINSALRGVLDEATGRWGIRVNRVELKGIDPPPSIKDSMEKQMRADRDKRAAILTAEGMRQSQILTAEGQKQSAILTAEGDGGADPASPGRPASPASCAPRVRPRRSCTVFQSIHDGSPDQALLAYQYLQMLPKIAEGDANKVWIVPSEIGDALEGPRQCGRIDPGHPARHQWPQGPGRLRRRGAMPGPRSARTQPWPARDDEVAEAIAAGGGSRRARRAARAPHRRPDDAGSAGRRAATAHRTTTGRPSRLPVSRPRGRRASRRLVRDLARGPRALRRRHRGRQASTPSSGRARSSRSRPCWRSAIRRCSPTCRTPSASCRVRCRVPSGTAGSWSASANG